MGINVLGPLGVDGDPHLSPRDRVILAALATSPGTADECRSARRRAVA